MRSRVGFLTEQNEKKAPDWFTSFSIEGLSFFLFTPSLQRNPEGGREKEIKGEKKKFEEKTKKEKRKERQKHMINSHVMQAITLLAN